MAIVSFVGGQGSWIQNLEESDMESLTIWIIGIVAALICGWLASYDLEGEKLFQAIRGGAFVVSIVTMIVAASVKNPAVSKSGAIAITVVILIGVVAIIGAVVLARFGSGAENKVFYVPAIIIMVIGLVATYPGAAHALFSLTAGS